MLILTASRQRRRTPHTQRGVALIIALIMLMVMTMVAVVAMRTTTIDLKITTNQIAAARAFQASETARGRIHGVLDDTNFYRGWPVSIGGTIPASSGFTIPATISINGLPDLLDPPGAGDFHNLNSSFIDMRMRADGDGDSNTSYMSNYDLAADIYVTLASVVSSPGSDTGSGGGGGIGAGAAGAGAHRYYNIVSVAGGGTATVAGTTTRSVTQALYRYVVTN